MNINSVCLELNKVKIDIKKDVDLSRISALKIGGNCALAIYPKNIEELRVSIQIAKNSEIKYRILGNCSNVLFSDEGYDGILIFTSKMRHIDVKNDLIYALCGDKLSAISKAAFDNSLSGFEFAHGIPGSCGGAVYMNAGAYGSDIASVLTYSDYYDIDNDRFGKFYSADNEFSYRKSIYSSNNNYIVLGAEFKLVPSDEKSIKNKIDECMKKRISSQPLEYPNAGSTFKRPEKGIAAKMIDECGLKGYTVGGAQVSLKHAGFIVNVNHATCEDVKNIIDHVKRIVFDKFNIKLEEEIIYID